MNQYFDVNHITSVEEFAQKMLNRLKENEHKDEIVWEELEEYDLQYQIQRNLSNMDFLLNKRDPESDIDFEEMAIKEAIDAANYLMRLIEKIEGNAE